MNGEVLFEAFGDIDERFIKGAIKMEKKKNYKWVKYAVAAAACLGIGVGAVAVFNQTQNIPIEPADKVVSDTSVSSATSDVTLSEPTENSSATTTTMQEQTDDNAVIGSSEELTEEQVYTLSQAQTMSVELVGWGGDHFKGIVTDAGDNSIFPVDAELSVVFEYDTEILLENGNIMIFNPDEPDTDVIGWKAGTVVTVRFVNYDEYNAGNHFYNRVYASYVESTGVIRTDTTSVSGDITVSDTSFSPTSDNVTSSDTNENNSAIIVTAQEQNNDIIADEFSQGQAAMEQVYTMSQSQTIRVKLVEWGGDHFNGIVVDAGDNTAFPVDAELSVVFDYDTEILLKDGTLMIFDPDEPDTDVIGWKEGTIVTIKFVNYDEYNADNHFYNCVYASYAETAEDQ